MWKTAYDTLGMTKEDIRLWRIIFLKEREEIVCSIAEASDLVENERNTQNHCAVMLEWVNKGENGELVDQYDLLDMHSQLFPTGGDWRTCDGWYSGSEQIFPSPQHLPMMMKQYIADMYWLLDGATSESAWMVLACLHIRYEKTHPFPDGNGRTGRVLLNYQAAYMELPYIKISPEIRDDYIYYLENNDEAGLAELFYSCSVGY